MQRAHMECCGPHTLGTEFLRHVIEESIRVWYAKTHATLGKGKKGLRGGWRGGLRALRRRGGVQERGSKVRTVHETKIWVFLPSELKKIPDLTPAGPYGV